MNNKKIRESMGFIDEDLITGAIAYQPTRHCLNRGYLSKRKLVVAVAIIMIISALSATVYATYQIIKEMNIFQKAAAEGKSVSEVDSAGDFNYTKPDIIADEIVQADSNQNVPEVFSDLKTDMYNKMLNSIDYLNRVKAVAVTNMIGEKESTITYHSDIDTGISYQSVMESDTVISETFSNILVGMTEVYHTEKTYVENYLPVYSREDTPYIPLEERIVEGEDGIPCYSYRRNITNCPLASYSIVPQEIAFSYLKDFDLWTIENESSTYLDRPCVVICGKPSPYISSKQQIDSFEMIVDKETGVLLSFSGTYQDTSVIYSKITHIDYEDQETIKSFVKEAYPEYTANRR